jgi:hypothetical protein
VSRVTQADVVRAAIQQLSKRGGYTPDSYFAGKSSGDCHPAVPGADVGATCAIGGVEQAIWRLTGESVVASFFDPVRERLAQSSKPLLDGTETPRQRMYASVMAKLNRKARKLFPELGVYTVEGVTFVGPKPTSRRHTLQVFEAVLADLEKPKASA